jgi:hypothetical protein
VYFYELHEGDEEIYSDVLLAHESEMDPDDFFELVQSIRRRIQDTYEDDTLIEAIAAELEREHDFLFISDDRLTAAVNVSSQESENFLAEIDPGADEPIRGGRNDDDEDEDEDEDEPASDPDFRSILADFDPRRTRPN